MSDHQQLTSNEHSHLPAYYQPAEEMNQLDGTSQTQTTHLLGSGFRPVNPEINNSKYSSNNLVSDNTHFRDESFKHNQIFSPSLPASNHSTISIPDGTDCPLRGHIDGGGTLMSLNLGSFENLDVQQFGEEYLADATARPSYQYCHFDFRTCLRQPPAEEYYGNLDIDEAPSEDAPKQFVVPGEYLYNPFCGSTMSPATEPGSTWTDQPAPDTNQEDVTPLPLDLIQIVNFIHRRTSESKTGLPCRPALYRDCGGKGNGHFDSRGSVLVGSSLRSYTLSELGISQEVWNWITKKGAYRRLNKSPGAANLDGQTTVGGSSPIEHEP